MVLEFDGIQFGFNDRPLLSSVYVRCETGKITGLLGRNGSGKSTLLKIVFGAMPIDMLSVRIDGDKVITPAFRSRNISYLAQAGFLPTGLSLTKMLALYKIRPDSFLPYFPEFLQHLDETTATLSGGFSRLFEVLLILASSSPFCLLDEPFSGLSPVMAERLQDFMKHILPEKGILITDHMYRLVMGFSDTLYILSNGKTFPVKSEDDLFRRGYLNE